MTTEQAFKKVTGLSLKEGIEAAVEAGYKNQIIDNWLTDAESGDVIENQDNDLVANLLLDPLFWQSLGKAMGWTEEPKCGQQDCSYNEDYIPGWQYQWHRFIDALQEDK